jgi:hypothetical protein
MRKFIVSLAVTSMLAGPLSALAMAAPPIGPLPKNGCELQERLGIVNIRECEDPTS